MNTATCNSKAHWQLVLTTVTITQTTITAGPGGVGVPGALQFVPGGTKYRKKKCCTNRATLINSHNTHCYALQRDTNKL